MKYLLLLLALVGCDADIDEAWQLDHDRIIAVRATPPRIPSGAESTIDALVGRKGARPAEKPRHPNAAPEVRTPRVGFRDRQKLRKEARAAARASQPRK